MWSPDRVARIERGGELVAAGYAIGPRHVLTARAAVQGREGLRVTVGELRGVAATMVWPNNEAFAPALLQTEGDLKVPLDLVGLTGPWYSAEFAEVHELALPDQPKGTVATTSGPMPHADRDTTSVYLECWTKAGESQASLGAPVVVRSSTRSGCVVAVVTGSAQHGDNVVDMATLTRAFACDSTFVEAVLGETAAKRHQSFLADLEVKVSKTLGASRPLRDAMHQTLEGRTDGTPEALARWLLHKVSGAETIRCLHDAWRAADEPAVRGFARDLVCHLLPASLDWRSRVYQAMSDLSEIPRATRIEAHSVTIAEAIMAGAEARPVRFAPVQHDADLPGLSAIMAPPNTMVTNWEGLAPEAVAHGVQQMGADDPVTLVEERLGRRYATPEVRHRKLEGELNRRAERGLPERPAYYLLVSDIAADPVARAGRWEAFEHQMSRVLPSLRVVLLWGGEGVDGEETIAIDLSSMFASGEQRPRG
ncbi:MAG: hypothetical protein AMXMBFR64_27770 [Myxococcales bacterium]